MKWLGPLLPLGSERYRHIVIDWHRAYCCPAQMYLTEQGSAKGEPFCVKCKGELVGPFSQGDGSVTVVK